ncbi:MAG: glycosyltransferase family 2 protein [Patescibacteria group bacterium]
MKTYIVIPAYNEEKTIGRVIEDLLRESYEHIVVVDDGSSDDTRGIIGRYPVSLCRHRLNCGQGAALRTGTDFALRQNADIIIHFDADGQHQVKDIRKFVEKIMQGYDIVIGSRFLGASYKNIPLSKRYLIHKPARLFNRLLTGIKLTDAHSGFRAVSREAAEKIKITINRMAHNTEIPAEVIRHRLRYAEVPVDVVYHEYGQNLFDAFEILADLLKHRILK